MGWNVPHQEHPGDPADQGTRNGTGHHRHAADHRHGHAHRRPARRPRRRLHRRVRRRQPPRPRHPLPRRRDGRRAVDRDGPVHLHRLGRAVPPLHRVRRLARPGLPDAPDRDPLERGRCCGWCRGSCGRRASPSVRASRARSSPSCSRRQPSGIVSGCLLAVARAAGETAPLLFTVGLTSKLNSNLFRNQNTSLSLQIFSNATQPFAGRPAAGVGRGADPDGHRAGLQRGGPGRLRAAWRGPPRDPPFARRVTGRWPPRRPTARSPSPPWGAGPPRRAGLRVRRCH